MRDIRETIINAIHGSQYIGRWYNNKTNWGDAINPILIEKLFGKKIVHQNEVYNIASKPIYSLVGSIINVFNTNRRVRIWGSGVSNPDKPMSYKPEKVYAVRGPKTHLYLKENGIDAPPVYGDPVLLIDRIYQPQHLEKKFKIGIIKHYEDQTPELDEWVNSNPDVRFISIIRDMTNPFEIIDEIVSCENIISSSLHGLILADVYKIPNLWVCFEGYEKNTYKYLDYYESISSQTDHYVVINDHKIEDFNSLPFKVNSIDLDLDKLYHSNPFS